MNIYKKRDNIIEKFEVVSVDKEGLYLSRKRFGRFFNKDLSTLIERVLDDDYTVVTKILNMPMPGFYGLKKNFGLALVGDITLVDYFRAKRFFDISVPQGPVEKGKPTRIFNGYFFERDKENLVKYGVRFDPERLINVRTHILATGRQKDNLELINAIDKLLQGTFAATRDIFALIDKGIKNPFKNTMCKEYFNVIKKIIFVSEYEKITIEEFNEWTDFFNIDCPEDFVPIAPSSYSERGAYAYDKMCPTKKGTTDELTAIVIDEDKMPELTEEQMKELEFIQERIDDSANPVQRRYWERRLSSFVSSITNANNKPKTL